MICMADLGYKVRRSGYLDMGDIVSLRCEYCGLTVEVRVYKRSGDKSGQGKYNRARAAIVKHIHEQHSGEHQVRLLQRNGK